MKLAIYLWKCISIYIWKHFILFQYSIFISYKFKYVLLKEHIDKVFNLDLIDAINRVIYTYMWYDCFVRIYRDWVAKYLQNKLERYLNGGISHKSVVRRFAWFITEFSQRIDFLTYSYEKNYRSAPHIESPQHTSTSQLRNYFFHTLHLLFELLWVFPSKKTNVLFERRMNVILFSFDRLGKLLELLAALPEPNVKHKAITGNSPFSPFSSHNIWYLFIKQPPRPSASLFALFRFRLFSFFWLFSPGPHKWDIRWLFGK